MKLLVLKTLFFSGLFCLAQLNGTSQVKDTTSGLKQREIISLGVGVGLDHGGFGLNVLAYPTKNLGLFVGLGYDLVGLGYNAGAKYRFTAKDPYAKSSVFLVGMYGYNGTLKVSDNFGNSVSKTYYGPTFGLGVESPISSKNKSYAAFTALVPIRPDFVNDYNYLKAQGASFNLPVLPILISFGFKFILN